MVDTVTRDAGDTALDAAHDAAPIKKPAERWRNKWRALSKKDPCPYCGRRGIVAGQEYWACPRKTHASRDIAESFASDQLLHDIRVHGEPQDEYLGAHPISEGE